MVRVCLERVDVGYDAAHHGLEALGSLEAFPRFTVPERGPVLTGEVSLEAALGSPDGDITLACWRDPGVGRVRVAIGSDEQRAIRGVGQRAATTLDLGKRRGIDRCNHRFAQLQALCPR